MSLVAYAASSEDESDEDVTEPMTTTQNEHITDEDLAPIEVFNNMRTSLKLPVPKTEHQIDNVSPLFKKLPAPKPTDKTKIEIVEEDDEFLHKKAIPLEVPSPIQPPKKNVVRITIPSLNDFDDLDDKKVKKPNTSKSCSFSGLMNMLPQPKSEQSFVKAKVSQNADGSEPSNKTMLVPDTVKNRRPAQNTEFVERKVFKKPPSKPKATTVLVNVSDSEESDEEQDFFSLQKDDKLPEVNSEEIAAMVSKKVAEMAKNSSKFSSVAQTTKHEENVQEQVEAPDFLVNSQQQLNEEAIQALLGSQAKRRKMDNLEIIDISSDQVHPNKDEWLRTTLASATTYNPTGVLNDDEPAAGTRRKHQITYLAHKAKANEAELQAMWATNRQNRRQTQSKYGF